MKKLIAMLLTVLMLAGLCAVAFADSPTQPTEPGPTVVTPGQKEDEEKTEEDAAAALEEAEATEAEATKAISGSTATVVDEETGEEVEAVVSLGALDEATATDEMKADHAALESSLVEGKEALAESEQDVIPEEIRADAEQKALDAGKTEEEAANVVLTAGQPFRAVAAQYPATITIEVENPADFVGMMIFVNGKWVKLNCTDNGDGTVTFVLDNPAVLSIVSSIEEAP